MSTIVYFGKVVLVVCIIDCTSLNQFVQALTQIDQVLRYLFLLIFEIVFLEVQVLTLRLALVLDIQKDVNLPQQFFTLVQGINRQQGWLLHRPDR